MPKKKILITGANGFLGSNLTKYLSRYADYEIFAMVRPGATINFLHEIQKCQGASEKKIEIIEADILEEKSVEKALAGMDIVIHLAGMVSDWGRKEDFLNLNVEGTGRILKGAEKGGVTRVIYLSSLTVHSMNGHTYSDESVSTDMKAYHYGVSKKMGEDLVMNWTSQKDHVQSAVVRPGFLIYGPYDRNTFIKLLDAIKSHKFCFINRGRKLISYVYVENLCYGIEQLIKAPQINGAYNILDGNVSWKEWIQYWADAVNVRAPKLSVSYWFVLPFVAVLEGFFKLLKIGKAPILTLYRIRIMFKDLAFVANRMKTEIGYEPPVSLEESIKATLDFFYQSKKIKQK